MHLTVFPPTETVTDDLTDHLQLLYTEAAQTVADMEAIDATSAAAAYYRMQRTCERFLTNPATEDTLD